MLPEIDPAVWVALIVGLLVDFDYAMTRLRGFGRLVFSKVPVENAQTVEDERKEVTEE